MTLTVRLDAALESALDRYSSDSGVTKSLVVQEALAEFLTRAHVAGEGNRGAAASENYEAFERAGLVATGTGDGRSATKDTVREQAKSRIARHRP